MVAAPTALDEYRVRIKTLSDEALLTEFSMQEYCWAEASGDLALDADRKRAICREVILSRMDYERGIKKK